MAKALSRIAVFAGVVVVAASGAALIVARGPADSAAAPLTLPEGRLQELGPGVYLALDEIKRSGENAEAVVLVIGGDHAFDVRRDAVDCGAKTITEGAGQAFDQSGAEQGESSGGATKRAGTASDAVFQALCASPPPKADRIVNGFRAAG